MGAIIRFYGRFLARFFYLVIASTIALTAALLTIALIYGTTPDFSDPDMGFETRDTDISRRVLTWRNLEEASKQSTILSARPGEFRNSSRFTKPTNATQRSKRDSVAASRLSKKDRRYFCGEPGLDFSRIVVGSASSRGLFNVEALTEICRLGDLLGSGGAFKRTCQYSNPEETQCCPIWSLGAYVADIRSKPCDNLTESDVSAVSELLHACLPYFKNGKLLVCSEGLCDNVPESCFKNNYVYDILYYLTDAGFLRDENDDQVLRYSVLFLPIATSTETSDFYFESLESLDLEKEGFHHIKLAGSELGLKWWLFEYFLLRDTIICVGLASFAVFACLWGYSGSFCLSFSTMTSGAMSLAVAYFFYTIAFSIDFFPYINLMAVALAMAVVADDSFILWAAWKGARKREDFDDIGDLVAESIAESWLPCTVTSLTTAGALYSSYVSSITAVKCFSIFAGTAVVVNLVLTLTWLPAWLVLYEKIRRCTCGHKKEQKNIELVAETGCELPVNVCARVVDSFFEQILPSALVRGRFAWISVFGIVGIGAIVAVTYYPGLRLPHSSEFQLFDMSHPFERYTFALKKLLPFEEDEEKFSASLPMRFVWGLEPVDVGNPLDPNDWGRGAVKFDSKFNMSSPESQVYLLDFCQDLRQQKFYLETPGAMIPNCFIESFKNYFMGRDCIDQIERVNLWPCCQDTRFPYKPKIFDNCVLEGAGSLYEAQSKFYGATPAGPKFVHDANSSRIGVVVIEYSSIFNFTFDNREMGDFLKTVQNWFDKKSAEAPESMKNGWFVSDLEFYDLQRSLSMDTFLTIGTDMGIAFVILLFTTFEITLSIFAILTVAFIIFSTVAALTLFGWTLNILESAIVTLAIGLAVDFTLHYGIAYKTAAGKNRREKVESAVNNVGVPVAMGALTTFLAGLAMLPSRVLAHVQIGVFLVVLMATSWAMSTFFLVPLLAAFGAERRCCSRGDPKTADGDVISNPDMDYPFAGVEDYNLTLRPAIVPQSHAIIGKTTRV